jgi:hypothetical protein
MNKPPRQPARGSAHDLSAAQALANLADARARRRAGEALGWLTVSLARVRIDRHAEGNENTIHLEAA